MKKIEILAPAGNMECLKAAIEAGCDAIYLGGMMFGARSFAGNFSFEELEEAVSYAHLYGVKIYVTVNTLVYESEVEMFLDYIDKLVNLHVDALIIQDIGMLDLIHQTYPDMELHASTQMHLHNLKGVEFASKLGCKRAVLAREVDIDTIRDIKKNTQLELEIFVHGALCISYSGQCLMSSLIGGRSGNRGTCAGTCRKKYTLVKKEQDKVIPLTEEAYLLSTKDLNTLDYVGELIEAGVDSIKIEGRMKRPSYVYAVVKLYRKAVDSYYQKKKIEIDASEIYDLQKIFHRGYTKGFLFHTENSTLTNSFRPNHLGVPVGTVTKVDGLITTIALTDTVHIHDGIRILGHEDIGTTLNVFTVCGNVVKEAKANDSITLKMPASVSVGSKVLKTTDYIQLEQIKKEIESQTRRVFITMDMKIKKDEKMTLTVSDKEHVVTVYSDMMPTEALKRPVSKEDILSKLRKLGNTVYELEHINIELDDQLFISMKEVNELRRKALSMLDQKRLKRPFIKKGTYHRTVPDCHTFFKKAISIQTEKQYLALRDSDVDLIYTPTIYSSMTEDKRVIRRLPHVMNQYPEIKDRLLVGELGSILTYSLFVTDSSMNVVNSYSLALLHHMKAKCVALSYELDERQIIELLEAFKKRYQKLPNVELVIYGREEIMISKFLLPDKYQVKEREHLYLQDHFHNLYPIRIEQDLMILYHDKIRKMEYLKKYASLGISTVRMQVLEDKEVEAVKTRLQKMK